MLLHKSPPQSSVPVQRSSNADIEDLHNSRSLVRKVLGESLLKLQEEDTKDAESIRWELGACWVQHLQNHAAGKADSKKVEESKVEPVKGLGKQGGLLKDIKKKFDERINKSECSKEAASNSADISKKEPDKLDEEKEILWKEVLSEAAYVRLKESETGLHLKVGYQHLYWDIILPKLYSLNPCLTFCIYYVYLNMNILYIK